MILKGLAKLSKSTHKINHLNCQDGEKVSLL
jgi:hypothetical protein